MAQRDQTGSAATPTRRRAPELPPPREDDLDPDDEQGDELDGTTDDPEALDYLEVEEDVDDVAPPEGAEVETFVSEFSRTGAWRWVKIEFKDLESGEVALVRHFPFVHDAGAGAVMAIAAFVVVDEEGQERVNMNALNRFFKRTIVGADPQADPPIPDHYARFIAACNRQDVTVAFPVLMDIYYRMMALYTSSRPLARSGSLPRSQRRHGGKSTVRRR